MDFGTFELPPMVVSGIEVRLGGLVDGLRGITFIAVGLIGEADLGDLLRRLEKLSARHVVITPAQYGANPEEGKN